MIQFNNELVKARLELEIGCYILEVLYNDSEFDALDAYSVIAGFVPANFICCREAYLYS